MDDQTKSLFKNLVSTTTYRELKDLANEMIDKFGREDCSAQTEFKYLQNSFERDGKQIGIRAFLEKIEQEASKV